MVGDEQESVVAHLANHRVIGLTKASGDSLRFPRTRVEDRLVSLRSLGGCPRLRHAALAPPLTRPARAKAVWSAPGLRSAESSVGEAVMKVSWRRLAPIGVGRMLRDTLT